MRELFKATRFQKPAFVMIAQANEIIAEYAAERMTITLRQLYYQFVSRNLFANDDKNYKNLGKIISKARLSGMIDWNAIEDRTRNVHRSASWGDEQDFLDSVMGQYALDPWDDQTYRPEVWVEKDALIGVLEGPCSARRVPWNSCRGYTSQSEQYAAGKRFEDAIANGQTPVVIYLGDHDPSGLDMTRDHVERLEMFARQGVEVRRIALNWDQVEHYKPPPNPAKMKDSRSAGYVRKYGKSSWELDALEPRVIHQLIRDEIESLIDPDDWDRSMALEKERRDFLKRVALKWPQVKTYVKKLKDRKPRKKSTKRK